MLNLTVMTWNVRRARSKSHLWEIFREVDPDVAMLQEVGELPNDILLGKPLSRAVLGFRCGPEDVAPYRD